MVLLTGGINNSSTCIIIHVASLFYSGGNWV